MDEHVPSPISTGGAGTTYEQHVGAVFLTCLLTGARPMIFKRSRVVRMGFQTRHLGWKTDDLLVECSTDGGEIRKMAVQVKFGTNIRPSSARFAETIRGFWEDFHADRFSPARDALVVATVPDSPSAGWLERLAKCARDSSDVGDFEQRLGTGGSAPSGAKRCRRAIRSILDKAGSGVTDEELWRFLKVVYVYYFDLATSTNQSEGFAKCLLENLATGSDPAGDAEATWNELVEFAADGAHGGHMVDRDSLPDTALKRHGAVLSSALGRLSDHSRVVLESISSTIAETVTLPREEKIAEAVRAVKKNQAVILTGGSGYGKSALAKEVVQRHAEGHTCLSFRAKDFAKSSIESALQGQLSAGQFESLLGQNGVLIHVESLEHLLEHSTRDAFSDLITIAGRHPNVRLLLTCRDQAIPSAISAFFERSSVGYIKVRVPPLDAKEMQQVKDRLPRLDAPLSQKGLSRLMRIPYYLDKAAGMSWSDQNDIPLYVKTFREKCWRDVVRKDSHAVAGLSSRREQVIVDLSMRRASELRPFVPASGFDPEALDGLCKDNIVIRGESGLVAPAHDIVEDWAVMKWIEQLAAKYEWQAGRMADSIGESPAVRRVFREWLRDELDAGAAEADGLVRDAFRDPQHPEFLKDVLISALLSSSVRDLVSRQKDDLLDDGSRLLVELMRLTRLACTKPSGSQNMHQYILLEPEGEAWPVLLELVSDNLDSLLPRYFYDVLGLLEDWVRGVNGSTMPDGAARAVDVAYRMLRVLGYHHDDIRGRVFNIVASVPRADSGSFQKLVEEAASDWYNLVFDKFRQILLGPSGVPACRDLPAAVAGFILSLRLPDQGGGFREMHAHLSSENKFGLRVAAGENFRHFSALCGPFLSLLEHHPDDGVRLVLDLVNHAGDWYGGREKDSVRRVEISVPEHGSITQWADERLWLAYRGTSDAPRIVMSALMALEHWLLDMCGNRQPVESLLLKILLEGRSVMSTAVVASVCVAHPDLGGAATLALSESQHCIDLDKTRREKEGYRPTIPYAATNKLERGYEDERKRSNNMPHRQRDLEDLAKLLHPKQGTPRSEGSGGRAASSGGGKTGADPPHRSGSGTEESSQKKAAVFLYEWGLKRWRRDSGGGGAMSWRQALASALDCVDPNAGSERVFIANNGLPVVAAVCVRDHWEEMSGDERRWCTGSLAVEAGRYSDDRDVAYMMGHSEASNSIAAYTLPKILAHDPDNREILGAVARSLTHALYKVSRSAAGGVADYLEPDHRDLALRCAGVVAMHQNLLAKKEMLLQNGGVPVPGAPSPSELARRAFVEGTVDFEGELEGLDLGSWRHRNAALSIITILGRAPDLPAANRFVARAAQVAVRACATTGWLFDDYFGHNASNELAMAALSLPPVVPPYCGPLLDAVDEHPDLVVPFIRALVIHADESFTTDTFWELWQAFADRIVGARWTCDPTDDFAGAKLMSHMMLNMSWLEGSRHWEHLLGHEERISGFAGRLPTTPHVLTSFARYLCMSGEGSHRAPLGVLAHHLRDEDSAGLLGGGDVVDFLAIVLWRYVNRKMAMLKADPALRGDTLLILERLVDAGSSVAYRTLDIFTTLDAG